MGTGREERRSVFSNASLLTAGKMLDVNMLMLVSIITIA